MTVTVLKSFFQKQSPSIIRYRDYKNFDLEKFCVELVNSLNSFNGKTINYEHFEGILIRLIGKHAPLKEKYVRANNASFMNKNLSKVFMTRSRCEINFSAIQVLLMKVTIRSIGIFVLTWCEKKRGNFIVIWRSRWLLTTKSFGELWDPCFRKNIFCSQQITVLVDDKIISSDKEVAETFNTFFSQAVENLKVLKWGILIITWRFHL